MAEIEPSQRWVLYPPAPEALLGAVPEHPLLLQVLYNRGLRTPEEMRNFLDDAEAVRDDPYRLCDMDAAVARIVQAIERKEIICVYGDFDADGVTSTALMVTALQAAGGRVGPYIPDRVDEGYGLNVEAIERVAKQAQLIVTVDCGMRSVVEVARANELGLDVIITDHHTVGGQLPPALAVVNPRRAECEGCFTSLAGVGVAYRLAQAVLNAVARPDHPKLTPERAAAMEASLLDLVALGTVADMMPLLGENRWLVRKGLERIATSPRPGIAALLAQAGQNGSAINANTISFRLGPRINAAGRMASARIAYELLRTTDATVAGELALELEGLNRQRQSLVMDAQTEVESALSEGSAGMPLLFVSRSDIRSGIVGLVAGRLAERFYRPAVVVEQGEYESRGSARSIREFDISLALDEVSGLLVRHGGHSRAAGFTVRTSRIPELSEALTAIAERELGPLTDLRPTVEIDSEVPLGEVNWSLMQQYLRLEPTGHDNPPPVLLSRGVRVREARTVGNGKHLRLVVDGGPQLQAFDAIGFGMGGLASGFGPLARMDMVYTLDVNEYGNSRRLQLNLRDMRPSQPLIS